MCVAALLLAANEVFSSTRVAAAGEAAALQPPRHSDTGARRNALIVVQFNEDVRWALDLVVSPQLAGSWELIVHCKLPELADALEAEVAARGLARCDFVTIVREPENWGDEAGPYLRFLATRYNTLPPLMFFLHGKPAEHTPFFADVLSCANPRFEKYFGAGFYYVETVRREREISAFEVLRERYEAELEATAGEHVASLNSLKPLRYGEGGSGKRAYYSAAQFLVSRVAIRRRPLAVWRALLTTIYEERGPFATSEFPGENAYTAKPRKAGAFWLEQIWHELLGEPTLAPWRGYADICGAASNTSAPLVEECCSLPEHSRFHAAMNDRRKTTFWPDGDVLSSFPLVEHEAGW